jgi:hypothetical protein
MICVGDEYGQKRGFVSGLPTIVVLAAESHRKPEWLQ